MLLPARLRVQSGWSDACILDISSRGMLIQVKSAPQDDYIELRKGEHVIIARVVWRDRQKLGLSTQERVPVDRILDPRLSNSAPLATSSYPRVERRARPRTHEQSRERGRLLEFVCASFIGAALAVSAAGLIQQAFAGPLAKVETALAGAKG